MTMFVFVTYTKITYLGFLKKIHKIKHKISK